ncbi:unnamed protein product [Phytomonas sp. EM1]|nr:unnamed protein product [Phytomonas sp. EM1]|eukprot:CCW62567.1 unnamed protein product [Phytomonas sp. isolate EM1]
MQGSKTESGSNGSKGENLEKNIESSDKHVSSEERKKDADFEKLRVEAAEAMRRADNAYKPYSETDNL